jgi:predicted amidohydrolase
MKFALVLKDRKFVQSDNFAYDILIKDGMIIDPANKRQEKGDVYIKDGCFAEAHAGTNSREAGLVIDASGCIVTPGLIDLHTHSFAGSGEGGSSPDVLNIPCGVTTVLDAGSSGAYNFESFFKTDICNSLTSVKALINVCSHGFIAFPYGENIDPAYYDPEQIIKMFRKYPHIIKGLKIRLGSAMAKNREYGMTALKSTIQLANEIEKLKIFCPVEVHVHDLPRGIELSDVVSVLRTGDIIAHCFSGSINIFNSGGHILEEILYARKRGILFDCCGNRIAVSLKTAREALQQGFPPDILATDITSSSRYRRPCVCLPNVLSMYMAMGMSLYEVIKSTTASPAAAVNIADEAGSLTPSCPADLAVFKLFNQKTVAEDQYGNTVEYDQCLVPMLTIRNGRMEFRQMFFQTEL